MIMRIIIIILYHKYTLAYMKYRNDVLYQLSILKTPNHERKVMHNSARSYLCGEIFLDESFPVID